MTSGQTCAGRGSSVGLCPPRAHLLDEGHGEGVPGDDAVVHELNEGRQREGQQVSEAARDNRHTNKANSVVPATEQKQQQPHRGKAKRWGRSSRERRDMATRERKQHEEALSRGR